MKPHPIGSTLAVALLTLTLGACGAHGGSGDDDESPSGTTTEAPPPAGADPEAESDPLDQAQLLVECMRENGVPDFPDPQSDGGFDTDDFAGLDLAVLQRLFYDECSEFSLGRH
jgi:hypothetical protein